MISFQQQLSHYSGTSLRNNWASLPHVHRSSKPQMEVLVHKSGVLKIHIGQFPTFSTSLNERFGNSPSQSPQDSERTKSEDENRHSRDAGLVSFAMNTMGSLGTAFTVKTKNESSQVREVGVCEFECMKNFGIF